MKNIKFSLISGAVLISNMIPNEYQGWQIKHKPMVVNTFLNKINISLVILMFKQLSLLFDLEKLASEEKRTINKLQKMQLSSGAFPWFDGGRANEHITRHIVAGVGHLNKLNVRK